jgi:hypothetical protein
VTHLVIQGTEPKYTGGLSVSSLITRHQAPTTYGAFRLNNEVVHLLLTRHTFIWFVEWNELIHHHLIPCKLIISICMRKE